MNTKSFIKSAVVAAVAATTVPAFAATTSVTFDPFGASSSGSPSGSAISVDAFDWSPGTSVGVGAVPLATFPATTAFVVLSHASLGNTLLGGITNTPVGMPEFTFVAGFGELGSSSGGGLAASFSLDPTSTTNFFEIWTGGAAGGPLSGTGYNDGTLVLRGVVTDSFGTFAVDPTKVPQDLDQSANGNQWGTTDTVVGAGASSITMTVDLTSAGTFVAPEYFPLADTVPQEFTLTFFNTSNIDPFKETDPSKCITDAAGGTGSSVCDAIPGNADATAVNPVPGAINGVTGPDFMFQTDANMSFAPEPATLALLGMGLAGMGIGGLRRRKAS